MQMRATFTKDEIIAALEAESEMIRIDAEDRMAKIHEAISTIRGRRDELPAATSTDRPQASNGEASVTSRLTQAAESLGDVILDNSPLRAKAVAMFPAQTDKIKRGFTNSVNALLSRKTFTRVPGGWKLTKFVSAPPPAPQPGSQI